MEEQKLLNETAVSLLENFGELGTIQAKQESEVKVLEVDSEQLTTRLNQLGAICTFNGNRQVCAYDSKDKKIRVIGTRSHSSETLTQAGLHINFF